jgi:hypothetical protein
MVPWRSRFKSNKFLDSVNAEFFILRGLLCPVVTWKPEAAEGELMTAVDLEGRAVESRSATNLGQKIKDIITQKISSEEGLQKLQGQMHDMMKSSHGAFEWPDPAPLVFPPPDDTATSPRMDVDGK